MDGVHFALGEEGRVEIGDYCYFTNAVLLCELELRIGNYVVIGWNATIADTDFHPLAPGRARSPTPSPARRWARAGPGRPIARRPVVIEDDVWIGPNATILKGVRIGAGAFVEAGALVTRDVPPRARVLGNPAAGRRGGVTTDERGRARCPGTGIRARSPTTSSSTRRPTSRRPSASTCTAASEPRACASAAGPRPTWARCSTSGPHGPRDASATTRWSTARASSATRRSRSATTP